jgi:hypothetical protein
MQQRARRQHYREVALTGAVDALNSAAGFKTTPTVSKLSQLSATSCRVRSQLESDIRSFDAADARQVTQEAVDELLGSTGPLYGDGGATTVRPYDPALLAWPAMDGKGLPLARDAPDDVMSYVEGNALGWVRTRSDVRKDTRHTAMPQLYRDEIFKNDRKHYVSFINEGARRGLFSFTKDKMESVAPFFVVKKDGRLRIIFDCRRSNRWFIRAPHVPPFFWSRFRDG